MQICLVNFCALSNCSTPEMLKQAPWIWDGVGGYDGPLIEPASLDIQVQEFEPLPGKEHKHILDIWCADESILVNPGFYAIPVDSLPSLDTLVDWILGTTRNSRRACFGSGFHGAFLSLALNYYECKRDLPLVSLFPLCCHYNLQIQYFHFTPCAYCSVSVVHYLDSPKIYTQ
jgi:hypothetical protein